MRLTELTHPVQHPLQKLKSSYQCSFMVNFSTSCSVSLPLHLCNYFLSISRDVSLTHSWSLSQIEEEFHEITLKPLQSKFLGKLDQYMPMLMSLYRRKGEALGK